jgi:hypothetical protein
MLLVYTRASSPRLRYIFDFIFRDILGLAFELTHDKEAFIKSNGPKLNYSDTALGDEPFVYATRLLFEKGISDQEISVFEWDSCKAFFATHPKYFFPFDLFASSFYLVSRYEEYLPHKRDLYNRFEADQSLAYEKGFLRKPLIDIWAYKLKDALLKIYPELVFGNRIYNYVSTIDIDNAYAYREKGLFRTTGAYLRSLFALDFTTMRKRTAVLLRAEKDPYDTYDEMLALQARYDFKSIYFFLLGDYGENDKNVPYFSKQLQTLIKSIADYSDTGIHPSFNSNSQPEKLKTEISRLRKILKRDVRKSRQHFLILNFPTTYRNLIDNDITDDYTMGYAAEVGFRASTCTPFYFYDLDLEVETHLKIHSFAIMDATLLYYMKVQPQEAMQLIEPLIHEVRNVNGTFISLWHNESLSDLVPWQGWHNVYEQVIKKVHSA